MKIKLPFQLHSLLLAILFSHFSTAIFAKTGVDKLVCEYHTNPIGIDVDKPRFSWQMTTDESNSKQIAYEIRVADSPNNFSKKKNLLWCSGKVTSDQSVNIEYQERP